MIATGRAPFLPTSRFDPVEVEGRVAAVSGLGVQIEDRLGALCVSDRVEIETGCASLLCEVVGFDGGRALALPFGPLAGVRRGARVRFLNGGGELRPSSAWLGRIVDGLGRPIDGKGDLPKGRSLGRCAARRLARRCGRGWGRRSTLASKRSTRSRRRRRASVSAFSSAAGVGKSALLGMIARNTACDYSVIALIGERGREVRDFVEDHLGPEGLARAVVVVATSDEPAMMRREAGFLALTIAEHFRDEGAHVLCLMDSLTRVAMAQREIGLAASEPPATRGYTPSVFSTLPALIERAGPGADGTAPGYVTGVFTVLVEGDDHDEPIADASRAILDGHIVLSRRIAESGRFPAVDILKSLSRTAVGLANDEHTRLAAEARASAGAYDEMSDVIRIGAYRAGANEEVDQAIALRPRLEAFLRQDLAVRCSIAETFSQLKEMLGRE